MRAKTLSWGLRHLQVKGSERGLGVLLEPDWMAGFAGIGSPVMPQWFTGDGSEFDEALEALEAE